MKSPKINLFGPAPNYFKKPFTSARLSVQQCAQLLQQGHTAEAEQGLKSLLDHNAQQLDAVQLMGLARMQRKDWAGAVEYLERALGIAGPAPQIFNNLGIALRELGRLDDALAAFDKALALQPAYRAAQVNKANSLRRAGRPSEALNLYDELTLRQANDAHALHGKGLCLQDLSRFDEAAAALRAALEVDPGFQEAIYALATVHEQAAQYEEAIARYRDLLKSKPRDARTLNGLGLVHSVLRQRRDAIQCFEAAIDADKSAPDAYANLAAEYAELDRLDEALKLYLRAAELGGDQAGLLQHVAEAYSQGRRFAEAAETYGKLRALRPGFDYALAGQFTSLMKTWDWQAAASLWPILDQGIRDGTEKMLAFDAVSFVDDPGLHRLVADREVAALQMSAPAAARHMPTHRQGDRIRLAYVSADFHTHATMHLMQEVFEKHNRSAFELVAVSLGKNLETAHREWLSRHFEVVLDGQDMSDRHLLEALRQLELDIAVDLKGHTRESRFTLFEARFAPIQISYLGYPGTTGSTQIDYVLGDAVVTQEADQPFYSERIWPLPGCYQANGALIAELASDKPSRSDEGLPEGAFVFACFNNAYKITPQMWDVWMDLLRTVPGSVLWLLENEASAQDRLQRAAQAAGVARERIVFARRRERAEHLARHALGDLYLDTLPYGAHTTASDALRSGCAMVTCTGNAFASRVGASLLTAIGCPELVTTTLDGYRTLALQLALNPDQLRAEQRRVRDGTIRSDLFNPSACALKLEAAYREMLQRHAG